MASNSDNINSFPKLSCNDDDIHPIYDVIVIGSGYGGAVAASRTARAGQGVCVLEKGKEWLPGQFPETLEELKRNLHVSTNGKETYGASPALFDVHVGDGITTLSCNGLGGKSLIDTAVSFQPDDAFFKEHHWPPQLRKDATQLNGIDAEHVNSMLRPNKWTTETPYAERLKKHLLGKDGGNICGVDLEDIGKHVRNLPLWINFKEGTNPLGTDQPACTGCGNCVTGCNVGAKNTLNINYLADAKAFGAHIFTGTDVSAISKDSYTGLWSVNFRRESGGKYKNQTVKASMVFIAAGVTGTTKILFQSKLNGLPLSQVLGHNITFNRFTCGFWRNLDDITQNDGIQEQSNSKSSNPGPTVTTAINLGTKSNQDVDGVVITDFTIPKALKFILPKLLTSESVKENIQQILETDEPEIEESDRAFLDNSLPIIATSKTKLAGKINFDATKGSIVLEMPANNLEEATTRMENLSKELGGEFLDCSSKILNGHFAMHPLGGCVMGETGNDGVVNHKGQVFIDNTSDVYDGLYVIDVSIIPRDVGVNPAMTICMLAERCIRHCAADRSWSINYDVTANVVEQLASHVHRQNIPGLAMTERMVGDVIIHNTEQKSNCEFVLDFKVDDIISMIERDPEHAGTLNGTVTCPALSKDPMAATGSLKLLRDSRQRVDCKEIIYSMLLKSVEGKEVYFHGIKYIHLDELGEAGLSDSTKLFVTIQSGNDKSGEILAEGVLYMKFKDFAKQLTTISVINATSVLEKWKLQTTFVKFFFKGFWDTYFKLAGGSLLDTDAPLRKKRQLRLGDMNPESYKVITEDKVELRLIRFQGGKKGPIMLVHGLGVASSLFLVDTVEQNFVEYLIEHGYDVWLFDWRASLLLPWACYTQYTVDECAKYDFPAGVDKVLEITKEKDLQLVIHCFGAITVTASILLGKLEGKVRCIITSQVSATPIGSMVNKFKSNSCLSGLFSKSGVTSMTAYVDSKSPWSEKTLNHMTRNFAFLTTKADQHCSSEVCHRITFLYGLLFEHSNLNFATHDILHELFGVATTKILTHTALITRKERIVNFDGKDVYLPGYKKKNRLQNPNFRRKMDLLNVPIMFFNGEGNQCWNPENLIRSYNMVKEANPNQDYVYYEAKGYGHLDTFLGRDCNIDIFPVLVKWLDKYAENGDMRDKNLKRAVFGALNSVDEYSNIQKTKSGNESLNLIQFHDLDEAKEIKVKSDENYDITSLEREKTEDFIRQESPEVPQESNSNEINDSYEQGTEEVSLLWQRKVGGCSCFQHHTGYKPPESTEDQAIVIESFILDDDVRRRDIIIISDLHLGSDWSRNIKPRLDSFFKALTETALADLHSIVLLGNIFDMTATAVAVTPPTKEEFMQEWKKDEVVTSFTEAIKRLGEENDVKIYYVRGDSDHDLTGSMAKVLLGDGIHFIPGCLVYKLAVGDKQYTIRFEHGHSADLFSDYNIQLFNALDVNKTFSYFIKRLVCSTEERFFSDSKQVLNHYVKAILQKIPPFGTTFMEILATKIFSKCFCKNLVERAIGKKMTGDECIIIEEGKWIRLQSLFESKFIGNAIAKYGSSEIFDMLKSSVTDLSYHVKRCHEDVVVMGHIHQRLLQRVHNRGGNAIYANTGTWIDVASHSSYVKIKPPKTCEHGTVELIAEEN